MFFLLDDNDKFTLADDDRWLLDGDLASLITLEPGLLIHRATYLRPVEFDVGLRTSKAIHVSLLPTNPVVSISGVKASRPPVQEELVGPGLTSGGIDVVRFLKLGSLRIIRKLGEPWECRYTLLIDTSTSPDLELLTEDGQKLLTEDGRSLQVDAPNYGLPAVGELVRISGPTATYRDAVIATDPWLYWPLDERDHAEINDYSSSGVNRGTADLSALCRHEVSAVPYGGSIVLSSTSDPCVKGPTLPLSSRLTIMVWVKRVTNSGVQNIIRVGNLTVFITSGRIGAAVSIPSSPGSSSNFPLTSSPIDEDWHHVAITLSTTKLKLFIDGVFHSEVSPSNLYVGGGSFTIGAGSSPGVLIDELSLHVDKTLEPDAIKTIFSTRNSERHFEGIVTRVHHLGWVEANIFQLDVEAVGLSIVFRHSRAKPEFITDGSETVQAIMQRILDEELPDQPINAYGIDVPELVAPLSENFDTVQRVFTRMTELHSFSWVLTPMGELVGHSSGSEPLSDVVLDETVNISANTRPYTDDSRLFRTQELVAAEGGRAEVDTITADGISRIFYLENECRFEEGISITVDDVPQTVDIAGSYAFDADFFGDDGLNAIGVPSSRPIIRKGAIIVIQYRSTRTQVVSVADIDAIRRYGIVSNVTFDNTRNRYTRRQSLAAALLAGNSSPTRRVVVVSLRGRVRPLMPGITITLNAPKAYGMSGGSPWLCNTVEIITDVRQRVICQIGLQQGPFKPFVADFYDRLLRENLPAPDDA